MPDTHRGPDPRDRRLFDPSARPPLLQAVADLSWLLGRGYAVTSALKLVGDRFALADRQRMAVRRSSCADAALARRLRHRASREDLQGRPLLLDGFNVLTTIEAALGGGLVLRGRDGSDRDLAGVHGTYRRVEETGPGIALLGDCLAELGASPCLWYLDSPVSNSGRLRALILKHAEERGRDWRVELVFNPDAVLAGASEIVATADGDILDRCDRWVPLARWAIEGAVPGAFLVDLSTPPTDPGDPSCPTPRRAPTTTSPTPATPTP